MKPSRFLTAICLLATALAVGSCTQGEGMDGNVQNLPEGMYPLTERVNRANRAYVEAGKQAILISILSTELTEKKSRFET